MSAEAYDVLSSLYDYLQKDISAEKWACFLTSLIRRHISGGEEADRALSVCDLGCGTARIPIAMSRRNFIVQGMDRSSLMLNKALENAERERAGIFLSCQDIRRFTLPEPVDVFLCLLDTVNHILSQRDVLRLFTRVSKFLRPGGLFIFDVLTPYYLEHGLGNQIFYTEEEDFSLFWRNSFSSKARVSTSDITLFRREKGPLYLKEDIQISEREHVISDIQAMLSRAGMRLLRMYGNVKLRLPRESEDRVFVVAQR